MATVKPEADLLAPTPATGHLIGYARTSRRNQLLDRQISALTTAGCKRIYQDQLSGKHAARPGLTKALDHLLEGDTGRDQHRNRNARLALSVQSSRGTSRA
jgi:hypothetical protein